MSKIKKYIPAVGLAGLKENFSTDAISGFIVFLLAFNTLHKIDKSMAINGRNLTNFGVFRKYITKYLENYPSLNKDMILLCRQLQPTTQGIPLEIYAFTKDKRFENYEYIMADVFDHIIASVPYFDLEIFELPSQGKEYLG